MELANKVCLITGASGALGSAVAAKFRAEGAQLALTYLTQKPGGPVSGKTENQQQAIEFTLDISQWNQVQTAVQKVVDQYGRIDVLANCTGVLGPIGSTASVDPQEWVHAIHVNLIGGFYLTRAVLPVLMAQGGGKIIHFSGGGAAYARPFCTAYSASKAALVRFTESVAQEIQEHGIDINIIAPGPVNSRMWRQMREAGEKGGRGNLEELRKMDETGGVDPDLAASLALFLASERSNGLSGRLISAVYDNWAALEERIPEVMKSESGTLRRVPFV